MLIRLLFIARRRWPILLAVPLLCGVVAGLLRPSSGRTDAPTYTATGYVAVDQTASGIQVEQDIISLQQGALREAAVKEVPGLEREARAATITAKLDEKSFVVRISATGRRQADVAALARGFTRGFIDGANGLRNAAHLRKLQQANDAVDDARAALDEFNLTNAVALAGPNPSDGLVAQQQDLLAQVRSAQTQVQQVKTEDEGQTDIYRLINVTRPSRDASSSIGVPADLNLRLIVGVGLGLFLAAGVTAFLEKLNPRIDDPNTAEQLIGAPVLAMVPVMNRRRGRAIRRVDPTEFSGPFAESFRALRSHLDYRNVAEDRERPARIMVVSATPSEGKTTSAAFLALSYTETGREAVVIGADVRRPMIHKLFGLPRTPGLSSLRYGGEAVSVDEVVQRDPVSGVDVVPSGPGIHRVTGLLNELTAITAAGQRAGRPVIVDTAPLMVANDAVDFLPSVDWVVVVVRMGRSTVRSVRQMITTLNLDEARIAGCVMVGSLESTDAKRYYYSYYAPDDRREDPAMRAKASVNGNGTAPLPDASAGTVDDEPAAHGTTAPSSASD